MSLSEKEDAYISTGWLDCLQQNYLRLSRNVFFRSTCQPQLNSWVGVKSHCDVEKNFLKHFVGNRKLSESFIQTPNRIKISGKIWRWKLPLKQWKSKGPPHSPGLPALNFLGHQNNFLAIPAQPGDWPWEGSSRGIRGLRRVVPGKKTQWGSTKILPRNWGRQLSWRSRSWKILFLFFTPFFWGGDWLNNLFFGKVFAVRLYVV